MHILLSEHLEGYLSGTLPAQDHENLRAHVAGCAECRAEVAVFEESAAALRGLRPPEGDEWEPLPGFYARVTERVEAERQVPFWTFLVDPVFTRRLVFASLMLLAVLGGYMAAFERADYPALHRPEAILACVGPRCAPALVPGPRLGGDLGRNRGVALAALVSGD